MLVNVSFQSHEENRQARHFWYNLFTKSKSDLLNSTVKLTDSKNKEIEFIEDKKNSNNKLINRLFSMNNAKIKKGGRRKQKNII